MGLEVVATSSLAASCVRNSGRKREYSLHLMTHLRPSSRTGHADSDYINMCMSAMLRRISYRFLAMSIHPSDITATIHPS